MMINKAHYDILNQIKEQDYSCAHISCRECPLRAVNRCGDPNDSYKVNSELVNDLINKYISQIIDEILDDTIVNA